MNRKLTGLLVALVLALVGTAVLVAYVQSARDAAAADGRLTDVLVVTRPIEKGTPGDELEGSVKRAQVPVRVRAEGAVRTLDQLQKLVAAVDLVAGEQLVTARFTSAQEARRGDVPEGKLEVTVALDPERAVGGHVRAGDTVAVLESFEPIDGHGQSTHLILHKVPVTAVAVQEQAGAVRGGNEAEGGDEDADAPASGPTATFLVTLAVDAPSVERVVFGAEHGTLWLSAEPEDAPEDGTREVLRDNVYEAQGDAR
jgi:pilus assembly protein CpaB